MKKSHFLFISSDWGGAMIWPGGVATYLDGLLRGLMNLGDTVKLLAVVRDDEKRQIGFLEKYKPCVIPFEIQLDLKPLNWPGRKWVSLLEIMRCRSPRCRRVLQRSSFFSQSADSMERLGTVLSCEKPAAVVFGYLDIRTYPLALALLDRQQPYGIIAHDSEVLSRPNVGTNDLVIRRTILQGATWVAANSRHTQTLVANWRVSPERIKLVFPPMSEEALRQSAVLNPSSSQDDGLRIVTICRLVRGKGVDIVIRALKILGARGIPCRYIIAGDGPERAHLERLVNELGLRDQVQFKGSVDGEEKWRLLQSSDVYVMPSRSDLSTPWQEGFGIAFAEAAAFGLPAVGSMSGGIPDAVVDGETGILVPEESPEDVADALTLLYNQPKRRIEMGKAGRERARDMFSPTAIATQFRRIALQRD